MALKKPPPLVPSSLIASCEATGPSATTCLAPSMVVTSRYAEKFWITPWLTSSRAKSRLSGSSTYTVHANEIAQKFPSVRGASGACRRVSPRARAMAMAMPAAAEMKLCQASPAIWDR